MRSREFLAEDRLTNHDILLRHNYRHSHTLSGKHSYRNSSRKGHEVIVGHDDMAYHVSPEGKKSRSFRPGTLNAYLNKIHGTNILKRDELVPEAQPTQSYLPESRGIFGRKIGQDQFIDDNGVALTFQGVQMYPEDTEQEPTPEYLDDLINYLQDEYETEIEWVNNRVAQSKYFALALLSDQDGEYHLWGRWYTKLPDNPVGTWDNKQVPGRWQLNISSSKKTRSGLSPQDLIKTDKQSFSSVPSIVDRISAHLPEEIRHGISQIATGTLPAVFPNQKDNLTAIRDNLGEIIQPIALMAGMIKGDAEKAGQEVLGAAYSQCKVVWPQGKNHNLIDSYFIGPNGRSLGISSKGDRGANASVQNISKAIAEAQANDPKLLRKHKAAIGIIELISNSSSKEGPIALAVKLGLLDSKLIDDVLQLVNQPRRRAPQNLHPDIAKFMDSYKADVDNANYNVGYHILSGIAKKCCEVVNSDGRFSKACVDFLNQSAIIQVYTDAKVVNNDVHITGFRSVYPANFSGSVLLTSAKNYSASELKGRFTFDYKKTG
jgi:hypothetical protein